MDKRRIAYHEAGHIVVGQVHGLEVRGITVSEKDGHADVPVNLESAFGDEGESYLERQLDCYFAGVLAEEILIGEEIEFCPGGVYTNDWNGAADCVELLAGRDLNLQGRISERSRSGVKAILDKNWDRVTALANAALERGTLSCKQVIEILAKRNVGADNDRRSR